MLHPTDRATRGLYILFLCSFATFGVLFTVTGAALPHIIRTFHWSYALTGVVLAASSVAYFLSTFASGFLVQRFTPKVVLITGLVVGAACMFFFVGWPSPWLNLGLNFGIGLCQGTIELVTNLQVIHMERKGQSRLMNLMHAGFSVGAIIGPAAVGYLLGTGSGGILVFRVAAGLLGLVALLFGLTRFPPIARESHREGGRAKLLAQPLLLFITLFLLLYVGSEIGVSTWVSEYFVRELSTSASTGAFAVSLFWLGIFSGRLAISLFYRGSRQELVTLALCILSVISLGVMLLVRSQAAVTVGVFLAGLGSSGIYPLLMAIVGKHFRSSVAVGTAATGGAMGSFLFPFLMAVLAQSVGLKGGFWFYLLLDLVMVALSVALVRRLSRLPAQKG
jgi:fucose permease